MRKRIIVTSGAVVAAAASGALVASLSASPASANGYPTPTPTVTVPTPTPTVTPVVNPFAGCRFSFSRVTTFAPQLGTFINRFDPAIVCVGRFGNVRVYDLVR
jgi:hypothetical protein